jgi:Tfp pilus assembly protein PilP
MRTVAAAVVCSLAFLGGCDDTATQPAQPPGQPAPPPANPQTDAPPPAVDGEDYARPEYPDSNRRNPFQPDPDVVRPQATVDEGSDRTLDPLEQFGVGQLELVAIISEVAIPKAMFLDPDGFGHVVKEGDRVGRNSAIITDIRDNEVELTETPDAEEGGQASTRTVKLSDRQLTSSDDQLSEEDREALRRLLESEEGVRALRKTAREELGDDDETGSAPPSRTNRNSNDPRFRGFAPPSKGE